MTKKISLKSRTRPPEIALLFERIKLKRESAAMKSMMKKVLLNGF